MSPRPIADRNPATIGDPGSRSASTNKPISSASSVIVPDFVRANGTPSWFSRNRTSSRSRTDLSNAPAAMVSMNPPASGPPQIGYGWSYVDAYPTTRTPPSA